MRRKAGPTGQPPEDRLEPLWYVRAQGRVWGPYPEGRLAGFVAEGRVAEDTLMSEALDGPFLPAGRQSRLLRLFHVPAEPELFPRTEIKTEPFGAAPMEPLVEHSGAARPLLVFAALTSLSEDHFIAALAIHGPYERIGAGLWLVRARLGAAALRNALSRRLRGGDTLLVVEAGLDHVAWFNLDQAEERRLRALWSA